MGIEMNMESVICFRCGRKYGKRRGNFHVSYGIQHKGVGHLPICKSCVESMYKTYLLECGDAKLAVRQMCRKLDVYWNEAAYDTSVVKSTARSVMAAYLQKMSTTAFAGRSYDDTLIDEERLWELNPVPPEPEPEPEPEEVVEESPEEVPVDDYSDITDDIIAFWGSGYTPGMYRELEQRRSYYTSKLPKGAELDVGSEALIRQICNLEVSIARDSVTGKSIDKSVNSLNTLLGSLNLRPAQQKDNDAEANLASTPLGVWLYRYENKRPLPEVDEQLKDVNHVKKYVFTWMGHLVKMLGIKNGYTKLYDDEIERLRVERPEYDEEDDEDLLIDVYSDSSDSQAGGQDG